MENNTAQPLEIETRQAEVASYATNISRYTAVLANLDGNWDSDLVFLKDLEPQAAAKQCGFDRLARLAELQMYDQVTNLLKTETVEHAKASILLSVALATT
jgi:hypothetical protein